jgi:glycosidase
MDASFKTVDWIKDKTIYEVNLRQYTEAGTFKAFESHIPRLKEMGVEVLWFMPVTPISEKGRKGSLGSYYACSSYTKLNAEFGTEQDFLSLIQLAHKHEMKVMIDWVANHTGRQHEWMDQHPDWFSQDIDGNFTERNGWEDVVDLNFENQAMRAALIGAMQYWVRTFNIDGFRCDMAHLVPLDFWHSARKACETIKPLFWLAECEDIAYHSVFDASYAWSWMHATTKIVNEQSGVNEIYNILHDYAQYPQGAYKLFFTSNHDENTWNGTEYEKYGIAAKAWAVFTFIWKGIPLLYSGQELPNHKRLDFFDKDKIEWTNQPLLGAFYKTLIELRKNNPCIIKGDSFNLPTNSNQVMAFLRYDHPSEKKSVNESQKQIILILLNFSHQIQKVELEHDYLKGPFLNAFSGLSYTFNKQESFELMPGDYLVYVRRES